MDREERQIETLVYTVSNSQSCRTLTKHIRNKSIQTRIHHITKSRPLTYGEIKHFLVCSHNGLDGLIAKKSNAYQEIKHMIDDMPLSDVINFIIDNPKILRFPIYIENGITFSGLKNIEANELLSVDEGLVQK